MIDMYEQYIKEREGAKLYKDERGFFTYRIDYSTFQVNDLFVLPEYRSTKASKEFAKKIDDLAVEHRCEKIFCTTCTDANNWQKSEHYILKNGYEFITEIGNMKYYVKEL